MHYLIKVHKKNQWMYNIVLFTARINKNNMKQTAVEWLAEKIGHNSLMALTEYNEILDQAKAMEKEQSHAEYMRGWKDGLTSSSGVTYRCCGLRLSIHGCGCPQETYKSE